MASEAQLLNALKNADAAGDTDAAKKLAAAVQQLRQQAPKAPAPDQPQPPKYVNPDASTFEFMKNNLGTLAGNAMEGTGRFIEQSAPAIGGAIAEYGESVTKENEADIARRGYQSTYQGSFRDQEGPSNQIGWIGEKMVENALPTLATYAGYGAAAVTAFYSAPLATLIAGGTTALTIGMGIGETTQELKDKTGGFDPNVAVAAGSVVGLLDKFGAGKALGIKKSALLKMSVSEITEALRKAGKGSLAKKIAKAIGFESVTEATQENVMMATAASQGGEYTGKEVLDRNIDSAILGGAMGGSVTTAVETAGSAKNLFSAEDGSLENPDTLPITTQQAGATFARRIDKIAREGDLDGRAYDLQDIDKMSQGGARAVIEASHTDLVGEIKNQSALLREQLRTNDQDTFDQRYLKVRAAVAEKMSRNKTKSVVTNENFKALEELVGGYTEGQALMNLIRESQIMTEVHNGDYQGQLSKITDNFAVFGAGLGYDKSAVAVEKVVRPIASMAFGYNTFGLSLLGQQALATIGTKIDKARGTYSSVDSFIKDNKDKTGLPAPRPPSVRAGRLQQAQAATQSSAGLEAFRRSVGGPELDNSPVGTITLGTGLDVAGLTQLLDQIESLNADNADVMDRVDQTRRNIAGENNQISDLTTWVSALNGVLNSDANLDALRSNDPDQGNARNARRSAGFGGTQGNQQQQQQQQQQQAPQGPSAAVQSGIDSNRAQLEKLRQGLAANTNLTRAERGILETALDNLEYNLGSDPAVAALDIVSRLKSAGISQGLLNNHIMPYVERVLQQQSRSGRRQQPPSTGNTDLVLDQDFEAPSQPALGPTNPLNIPAEDINATSIGIMPTVAEIQQMRDGAYTPAQKRTLVEAVEHLNNRWQKATGQSGAFEYTPENVDRISSLMATEAMEALNNDGNAIGWYDRKIKAAKVVTALVEPRITQSADAEAAFDFALAVTSNGQAVAENFEYAVEVFRHFMDTGVMPTTTWKKGGERRNAMVEAFDFFNIYNASGRNMPIQDFLDTDLTVAGLTDVIDRFNEETGASVSVPTSEGPNAPVKASYIIGPKIGQGFYQNIRGNYDPLTMDIWWMRMWNRLVGRPFETTKDVDKNRRRLREALKPKNQDALEQRLTRETLKALGLTRAELKKDTTLDDFVLVLDRKYQSYFRKTSEELKGTGKKVPKPSLFQASGTMKRNMSPQLQAMPKNPTERAYMREVTQAAIVKLKSLGFDIKTADFQALMWYPEKQLFRKLGVAKGRGADNDYLDAAKLLAVKEGVTNEQIEQTLSASGPIGEVSDRTGAPEAQGSVRGNADRPSGVETGAGSEQSFDQDLAQQRGSLGALATPEPQPQFNIKSLAARMMGSQPANPAQVKAQLAFVRPAFEIGKAGTKYADGIQDIESAKKFANAINVTLNLFDSQQEMFDAMGRPLTANSKGIRGAYAEIGRDVFGLNAGAQNETLGPITDLYSLTTILHELGHAVAKDSGFEALIGNMESGRPARAGSLPTQAVRKRVSSEINNIQKNVDLYLEKNPKDRRPVRRLMAALQARKDSPEQTPRVNRFLAYINQADERSVDPVLLYFVNPRLAKAVAPTTSKLVRESLNASGNQDFQLYTYPFATIVAVVLAMLANGRAEEEEEEEKRKQQMQQQGALSQQQGALSQQQAA